MANFYITCEVPAILGNYVQMKLNVVISHRVYRNSISRYLTKIIFLVPDELKPGILEDMIENFIQRTHES